MTPPLATLDAEALLAHTQWVRALARRLVRDPHEAEDLAQETCLAALLHRPDPRGEAGGMRAWLATVLRNLVRQGARSAERRAGRERATARAEATDSTLALVERWSVHQSLVRAVDALDEPYRSTLLLRYFEELVPSAIARRTGVPLATVKSRLARGLAELRARLERDRGPRGGSMLAALVPLTWKSGAALPLAPALGALVMSTQIKIAAALLAVLAGGYVLWPDKAPEAVVQAETAQVPEQTPPRAPASEGGQGSGLASNPSVATRTAPAPRDAAPVQVREERRAPAFAPVAGRVIGVDGAALVGETVVFTPEAAREELGAAEARTSAVSGPLGRFTIETSAASGRLLAGGEGRTTLLAGVVSASRLGVEPVVVVAPHQPLAGRVLDEQGRALAGVRLTVQLPEGFRSRLGGVLDSSLELPCTTQSDAAGDFDLPRAPFVEGARLTASLAGYEPWTRELPRIADSALAIVLARPRAQPGSLTGLVVDPRGAPVPDASVAFGLDATRTDEHGTFTIEMEAPESSNAFVRQRLGAAAPARLVAMKPGFLPAGLDLARDGDGNIVQRAPIVLTLGGPPLSIAGRVVDGTGRALAGSEVWVADLSLFSMGREGPVVLENALADRGDVRWHSVTTDDAGRFEIDGLTEREYTLEAMDPATLLRARPVTAAAGRSDVELVLPSDGVYERVSGRVVTQGGTPVAGVTVAPMCDGFKLRYQTQVISTSHSGVDGVRTGPDGRFELARVPRDLVYLRIDGEDTLPVEYGRHVEGGLAALSGAAGAQLADLEIVVPVRMRLRVELSNPAEADGVEVLDRDGKRIVINLIEARGRRENVRMPVTAGRTEVLTVTDSAATLVLFQGEREVRRVPLALTRGDVNLILL